MAGPTASGGAALPTGVAGCEEVCAGALDGRAGASLTCAKLPESDWTSGVLRGAECRGTKNLTAELRERQQENLFAVGAREANVYTMPHLQQGVITRRRLDRFV